MIKADHKKWARIIFNFYIDRLLKKNFYRFLLINDFPDIPNNSKLIVTPNHFSWWDGFFIDYIFRKLSFRKIHIMMLEKQLKRFWFFKKVGAYSINLNNPKSFIQSLNYSKEVLNDSKNFVVIYPQGEIEPFDKRALTIKNGIYYLTKNSNPDTLIFPISFKIIFGENKKPDILCRIGKIIDSNEVKSKFKNEFLYNIDALSGYRISGEEINLFKL